MSSKQKILVPTYTMKTSEFETLMKVYMQITGKRNFNGLRKSFFKNPTTKEAGKYLKGLEKKNILIQKENNQAEISETVKVMLEIFLESEKSLSFQNSMLKKKDKILTFYYANGKFAAVMSGQNDTTIACSDTEDGVMSSFEDVLMAKGISNSINLEKLKELSNEKYGEPINNPSKSCLMGLGSNKEEHELKTTIVIANNRHMQIFYANEITNIAKKNREILSSELYYGVIKSEISKLKELGKTGSKDKDYRVNDKTEYEKIVDQKDFPKNGIGFIGYMIKQTVKSIPLAIKNMAKNKFIGLILAGVFAVILFVYNIYVTCFVNDTFMFDRRSVWGNLTPYLMGGQIKTPNELYGFDLSLGNIDTTWLVAPLFMVIALIGRHLLGHISKRKIRFFTDITVEPVLLFSDVFLGKYKRKQICLSYIFAFSCAFIITNPLTVLALSLMLGLIHTQGRENSAVQFFMLYSCALGRKKIDAGAKNQPTMSGVASSIGILAQGFFLYSIVNLLLWILFSYNFYIRVVVTLLLIAFCIMQLIVKDKKSIKSSVLFFTLILAQFYLINKGILTLADDGGITESGGTLIGLIQNAGFGTILGISLAVIGIAIGGAALIPFVAAGVIAGLGIFAIGATDTAAGRYVSKSADQYFNGVDKGDKMTALNAAVTLLDLVTSFIPVKGGTKAAMLGYHGMQLSKDLISAIDNSSDIKESIDNLWSGKGDFDENVDNLLQGIIGLGLDVYGIKGDIGDVNDAMRAVRNGSADDIISNIPDSIDDLQREVRQTYDDANQAYHDASRVELENYMESRRSIDNSRTEMMNNQNLTDEQREMYNNVYDQTEAARRAEYDEAIQNLDNERMEKIRDSQKAYTDEIAKRDIDAAINFYDIVDGAGTVKDVYEGVGAEEILKDAYDAVFGRENSYVNNPTVNLENSEIVIELPKTEIAITDSKPIELTDSEIFNIDDASPKVDIEK